MSQNPEQRRSKPSQSGHSTAPCCQALFSYIQQCKDADVNVANEAPTVVFKVMNSEDYDCSLLLGSGYEKARCDVLMRSLWKGGTKGT